MPTRTLRAARRTAGVMTRLDAASRRRDVFSAGAWRGESCSGAGAGRCLGAAAVRGARPRSPSSGGSVEVSIVSPVGSTPTFSAGLSGIGAPMMSQPGSSRTRRERPPRRAAGVVDPRACSSFLPSSASRLVPTTGYERARPSDGSPVASRRVAGTTTGRTLETEVRDERGRYARRLRRRPDRSAGRAGAKHASAMSAWRRLTPDQRQAHVADLESAPSRWRAARCLSTLDQRSRRAGPERSRR